MIDRRWPFDKNISKIGIPLAYFKPAVIIGIGIAAERIRLIERMHLVAQTFLD